MLGVLIRKLITSQGPGGVFQTSYSMDFFEQNYLANYSVNFRSSDYSSLEPVANLVFYFVTAIMAAIASHAKLL